MTRGCVAWKPTGTDRRRTCAVSVGRPLIWVGLLLVLLVVSLPAPARAVIYTFTEIATDQGAPFAKGFDIFPAINESGTVAFCATLDQEVNGENLRGIFTGDGGPPNTIADTNGPFAFLGCPSINDLGDVAFGGTLDVGGRTIVRYDAFSNLPVIIAESNPSLGTVLTSQTPINNAGAVALLAQSESNAKADTVLVGTGGLPVFVDLDPGPNRQFENVVISVNGSSLQLAYRERDTGGNSTAIVRGNTLSKVTIADTDGPKFSPSTFGEHYTPSIDDSGRVAFSAALDAGGEGVFVGIGSVTGTVVDSSGAFDAFRGVALSNTGVAFKAELDLDGGSGVFTGPDPISDKVIATGDSVPGFPSTVTSVLMGSEGLNDLGQIAMRVSFANGRERILRADPLVALPVVHADAVAALVVITQNASLRQVINMPRGMEQLEFDYLFPTTTGKLVVKLGEVVLKTIRAPRRLADNFRTVRIRVDPAKLSTQGSQALALEFSLEGSGVESGVLLEHIVFPGVVNGDFASGNLGGWEVEEGRDAAVGVAVKPGVRLRHHSSGR